jgi:tRNA(adenine34) deaminase
MLKNLLSWKRTGRYASFVKGRLMSAYAARNAVISVISITVSITALSVFRRKKLAMRNDDEHFMRLALEQAEKAYKREEVPVGAILIIENEVIASAYNVKESTSDPTAHAELIAIREGAMKMHSRYLTDAVLYATKEPCTMCAGAMVNARLGRLVYGCSDKRFGAINSRYQIVSDPSLNHQVTVLAGVLEQDCADILKRFFRLRR